MSVLSPGTLFASRYRVERLVGEGGMGEVWAAEHTVTGKRVALKLVKQAADSPSWRRRLVREARAACSVRHPNVVAVHDVLESEDGAPVLVMDLLEGETLRSHLTRRTKLTIAEACDVLLPVVSAVGTAHASGIVHRDLKPENVFLTSLGEGRFDVRVLDFGIAKLMARDETVPAASLTGTGSVFGTLHYMAPEQIYAEKDLDHRADVWALGVMLYECLAGRRPTDGENLGQVLKVITSSNLEPITNVAPDLPPDLASLIMRMLSRDAGKRPNDLREVRDVLLKYGTSPAPPFGAPAGTSSAESVAVQPPSEGVSGDAPTLPQDPTTATFEGLHVGSGAVRVRGTDPTRTSRAPEARSRVPRIMTVAAAFTVLVTGVTALAVRSRTRDAPVTARSSAERGPVVTTNAPSEPPSATPTIVTLPSSTALVEPAASSTKAPSRSPASNRAPKSVDASAPVPSATSAPARPAQGGIVETPPF